MKIILISLFLLSNLVFAQTEPTAVVDKNADIQGSIAEPTPEQKKHVHDAAKKAKKKKEVKKNKALKKTKKKSVK